MTRKYKAVIVDDEQLARDRLSKLLSPYTDKIEVIGEATDGEEALVLVESLQPDLVFLDVQMPVMDGFEMLKKASYKPRIIFTTAFDQYAIKAFEENSVDYLLKPIEEQRLRRTILKLETLEAESQKTQLQHLLKKLGTETVKTLTVSIGDRMILIPVENITHFHAEDRYVFIHDKDGKKHLLSTSLTELENKLGDSFIRIHRAFIINRDYVLEIRKSVNGKLTFHMGGKEEVQLTSSHSYTPSVRKMFLL